MSERELRFYLDDKISFAKKVNWMQNNNQEHR